MRWINAGLQPAGDDPLTLSLAVDNGRAATNNSLRHEYTRHAFDALRADAGDHSVVGGAELGSGLG